MSVRMGMSATDVVEWVAKRDVQLSKELALLGADPNGERTTMGGWAMSCNELRERIQGAGGIRGRLSDLYNESDLDLQSECGSALELVLRDAMRDSMLTFRERVVLATLIDYTNICLINPHLLRPEWPSVRQVANDLSIDEADMQAIFATLITRGWLPMPNVTRQPLKPSVRFSVMDRDGFRCVYCGANGSETTLHVDHVTPVSKGGTDDPANLATACEACNIGKSSNLLMTPLRVVRGDCD